MIEYLWSRAAMIACGLVIMIVMASVFSSLDESNMERAAVDGAEELSEFLERFPAYGGEARAVIETSRFLPTSEHSLLLANGSVWTVHGDKRIAVELSARLFLVSDGEVVRMLKLGYGQSVRIENTVVNGESLVLVQLEKVATISLTASTNFLHSASVL